MSTKSKLYSLAAAMLIMTSCNQADTTISKPVNDKTTPTEIIRVDEKINDFTLHSDQHTLEDLYLYTSDLQEDKQIDVNLRSNINTISMQTAEDQYNLSEIGTKEQMQFFLDLAANNLHFISAEQTSKLIRSMMAKGYITKETAVATASVLQKKLKKQLDSLSEEDSQKYLVDYQDRLATIQGLLQ